jgi:hypothetical protein
MHETSIVELVASHLWRNQLAPTAVTANDGRTQDEEGRNQPRPASCASVQAAIAGIVRQADPRSRAFSACVVALRSTQR